MAQRQAAVIEMLFERQPVYTRLTRAAQVGFIDFEDAIERGQVDHELALIRANRAANPGRPAERRDRDRVGRRPAEDRGDLLTAGRPSHEHSGPGLARAPLPAR